MEVEDVPKGKCSTTIKAVIVPWGSFAMLLLMLQSDQRLIFPVLVLTDAGCQEMHLCHMGVTVAAFRSLFAKSNENIERTPGKQLHAL